MAKGSDNDYPSILITEQASKPTAPAAGKQRIYMKTDHKLYHEDSGGTETEVGGGGTLGGSTGSTDNAIIRADGTGGATVQSSLATVDDSGSVNIPTGQTYDINGSPHTHAGGSASHTYFAQLCALLEPDALEAVQTAAFTYTIASNATKYMIGSWATQIGGAGRVDLRRPSAPWFPLPLRGVTVTGTVNSAPSRSTGIFLDPTLPTYTDSWTTYYDRLDAIWQTQTRVVHLNSDSQRVMLLPGAYGAILIHNTSFNFTWLSPVYNKDNNGWAFENELGDASGNYQRVGANILTPVHKHTINGVLSGISTGSTGAPFGTVVYILCPSTWSKVTDPNTYDFRDDFMGASIDTSTVWTKKESSAGNMQIDTAWQWLKAIGSAAWDANSLYSQASITKANGKVFLCDVYIDSFNANGHVLIGFSDGLGHNYTNIAYGLIFAASGGNPSFTVFENGNSRGTVGSGFFAKNTYRVRITTLGSGTAGATYEIQSSGEDYAKMGGATWTDITPGTSSSATTTLHAGVTAFDGTTYISDMRIY